MCREFVQYAVQCVQQIVRSCLVSSCMLSGQVAAFSPEKISKSKVIRLLKAGLIEEVRAKPSPGSPGSLSLFTSLLSDRMPGHSCLTLTLPSSLYIALAVGGEIKGYQDLQDLFSC